MNNPDHERLREIESSAKKVDELARILDFQRQETKLARQAWEEAVERHLELCRATEESQDVADAPLLRRIEEVEAQVTQEAVEAIEALEAKSEANGQPVVADAVTADHEEDDPDWHGKPVISAFGGHPLDQALEVIGDRPNGWDLVTSRPLSNDAKAEADALTAIEAGSKKAKGRKGKKGGS